MQASGGGESFNDRQMELPDVSVLTAVADEPSEHEPGIEEGEEGFEHDGHIAWA